MDATCKTLQSVQDAEKKYAAFIDVLGFADLVLTDFVGACDLYGNLIDNWGKQRRVYPEINMKIYSDSILLTSNKLDHIVGALQVLSVLTMAAGHLVRGGIGFGLHKEINENQNILVVSDALTQAALVEKTVKKPCIAFHQNINISSEIWIDSLKNIERKIIYYQSEIIINPFCKYWSKDACSAIKKMKQKSPAYKNTYDWLLELYEAVKAPQALIRMP